MNGFDRVGMIVFPRYQRALVIRGHSPIIIEVTDPLGRVISPTVNEIPGALYIEVDMNLEGDSEQVVIVPLDSTLGDCSISITAKPGTDPSALYSAYASFTYFQNDTTLSENSPVSSIPPNPYTISTFENLGPSAPSLSVADSTTFSGYPATLTWTSVSDPNPGHIVSYDVIVATQPDFSDSVVLDASTSTSFLYHSWMKNKADVYDTAQHYWKVFAHDDWGAGSYSAPRLFSVSYCCKNLRGDVNGDGANVNILDLTFLVDRIFRGGPPAPCPEEADANSDGTPSNILDLTYLVDRIFRGGPPPGPC